MSMRADEHLEAAKEFDVTLDKLKDDLFTHRRVIIEGCVVTAAHLVNAYLHRLALVPESIDIKHNRIPSYLRSLSEFEGKSELTEATEKLEYLKYSVVHGVTRNAKLCKQAIESYEGVKRICLP